MSSLRNPAENLPPPAPTPYLGQFNFSTVEEKRSEILKYFLSTWELNDSLFECLADDERNVWHTSPVPQRHALVFYFGHNAAFFVNKFADAGLIGAEERIDEKLEVQLAVGIDEMSTDAKPEEQVYPNVAQVREFRHRVKRLVIDVINRACIRLPIQPNYPEWAILMGIEHERIHVETSSVLIRQLPICFVRPRLQWPICPSARHDRAEVPENRMVSVSGKLIFLGKTDDTYGWDNEYGLNACPVFGFEVSQFLVSNAEYLPFVLEGGYANKEWWDEEGWDWCEKTGTLQPSFWVGQAADTNKLKLRVMTEEISMPWDWPVEVNQLEATAFCNWKSKKIGRQFRLPHEGEWYRLREMVQGDQPDWKTAATTPGNINLAWWASSCPIDFFKQTPDCYDVVGNVWQWTDTALFPLDSSFREHPLYEDYSAPTFDGKHFSIRGGSWISTGHVALKAYRNAFRRHFFQHAGFRYVTSAGEPPKQCKSTASGMRYVSNWNSSITAMKSLNNTRGTISPS